MAPGYNRSSTAANRSTGDQSVYQEEDDAYLICTLDKLIEGKRYLNQSLAIFKLTPDYLNIEKEIYEGFHNVNGDRSIYPRHHTSREASHIIKVDGKYYWFSSGLLGWRSSQTMYATALSLAGPWSDLKALATEPLSPDSFNTQHDFVIPVTGTQAGTEGAMTYSPGTKPVRRSSRQSNGKPSVFTGGRDGPRRRSPRR